MTQVFSLPGCASSTEFWHEYVLAEKIKDRFIKYMRVMKTTKNYNITLGLGFLTVLAIIVLSQNYVHAQGKRMSGTIIDRSFRAAVYFENTFSKAGLNSSQRDTLFGSGFLISDHGKVYLVAAKHTIQNKFLRHGATDSILINGSPNPKARGFKFAGFIDPNPRVNGFVLSGDADDIAIISFQKNAYKFILNFLRSKGSRPLPVSGISKINNLKRGDTIQYVGDLIYKLKGVKTRIRGVFQGKVQEFDQLSTPFLINAQIMLGHDGASVYVNNKVVGMVKGGLPSFFMPSKSKDTYPYSTKGIVVKSSVILSLLAKLQQLENQPNFN